MRHDAAGDADFGDDVLENREEERDESQEHELFFDLLEGFVERLLVLLLEELAAVVEETLQSQRYGYDDGANRRYNPCGSVLEGYSFLFSATHLCCSGICTRVLCACFSSSLVYYMSVIIIISALIIAFGNMFTKGDDAL